MDSTIENVNSCMLVDASDFFTVMHKTFYDFTYQLLDELPLTLTIQKGNRMENASGSSIQADSIENILQNSLAIQYITMSLIAFGIGLLIAYFFWNKFFKG